VEYDLVLVVGFAVSQVTQSTAGGTMNADLRVTYEIYQRRNTPQYSRHTDIQTHIDTGRQTPAHIQADIQTAVQAAR